MSIIKKYNGLKKEKIAFTTKDYDNRRILRLWIGELEGWYGKLRWLWHENDQDMWPSYPHLHAKKGSYKMDIYTGTIYETHQNTVVRNLSNKEMKKLWEQKKFCKHVEEKRKFYMEKIYDGIRYKELPKCYVQEKNYLKFNN